MESDPAAKLTAVSSDGSEDASWVASTLAGDLRAFDRLIERYQRRALSVAYRLLGNLDDASEVCQEAFLRAYRSLDTLDAAGRFGAWLMRIVSNLALNFRRGRKPTLSLFTEEGEGDEAMQPPARGTQTPAQTAISGELGEAIQKAVDGLPEKQRLALVMFAIEGMPQKEVAEILEMSVEAVKWNVFAARKTLRERLAEYLTE